MYFTHLDRATTRRIAARSERAAIASVDDARGRPRDATHPASPRSRAPRTRTRGRARNDVDVDAESTRANETVVVDARRATRESRIRNRDGNLALERAR